MPIGENLDISTLGKKKKKHCMNMNDITWRKPSGTATNAHVASQSLEDGSYAAKFFSSVFLYRVIKIKLSLWMYWWNWLDTLEKIIIWKTKKHIFWNRKVNFLEILSKLEGKGVFKVATRVVVTMHYFNCYISLTVTSGDC